MKLKSLLTSVAAIALSIAASAEEPIITFTTDLYKNQGSTNAFSFYIGGKGEYIDVDCGFGSVEYDLQEAVYDSSTQSIKATTVTGTVSSAGIVKIYGDASGIDYLSLEGCYITSISMPGLTNLQILNMEHNNLEGLDLTGFSKLQAIYLSDNPFSAASPLKIGGNKPELALLQIDRTNYLDSSFNLSDYPEMVSFQAFGARGLTKCDPTGCPELMQLSIDVTPVETLDVTKNPKLTILNIADTKITSIDVSQNPALQQFYCSHAAAEFSQYKLSTIDVSHNPELYYFFAGYNNLTEIDLSKNPKVFDLSLAYNNLTNIDLSNNNNLYNVDISKNYLTFATLPTNPGDWGSYLYAQRPMTLNKSYKVGDEIDFSSTMLREGTETVATLYAVNFEDYSNPTIIDPSYYSFTNGKFKLNEAIADSVYISFDNSEFSDYPMTTTNFVVKSAADFGKDIQAITFLPSNGNISFKVGICGATPSNPKTFKVYFGDKTTEYTCTGSSLADATVVTGNSTYVQIYVPEGTDLSSFAIEGYELYGINFVNARSLTELTLTGTKLYDINLEYLYMLNRLELRGNQFYKLKLSGATRYFMKNRLSELIVPSNTIAEIETEGFEALSYIDVSDNRLETFNFETAKNALYINAADNNLTTLNLSECVLAETVIAAHNEIAEIILPVEEISLVNLDVSDNKLNFATLPNPVIIPGNYSYANQAEYPVAETGPGIDLSSQYLDIDGHTTTYTLYKTDGTVITGDDKYTETNGKIKFVDSSMGVVYCIITNAALPALSLRTTNITVAPMPTDVVASFTTPVGGQAVSISLAAEKITTVFIDWKGDGIELDTYNLNTTYTLFDAVTTAGANVKIYAYADAAPLTVFSFSGATMKDIDLSHLTSVTALTLDGAGLSEVTLPNTGLLQELILNGNNLSSIDLSGHPAILALSLSNNAFTGHFDLSPLKNLQLISLSNNQLTSVSLDNSNLWFLDLSGNSLSDIDLSGAPVLEQLSLSNNQFSSVDVDCLGKLRVLTLDHNLFTFATLPEVKSTYAVYTYANQAEIAPIVEGLTADLSSQAYVDGTPTEYSWFIDMPTLDEEDNWIGEMLEAGEEFTVFDGVTTFERPLNRLVCLMQNAKFPKLSLFSTMIDLSSGIEDVSVENLPTELYNLRGQRIYEEHPAPGIYIRRQGKTTTKVLIK